MTIPDCIGETGHTGGVRLTRELWGAVLHALRSGGPAVRERVAASVEAIGPVSWRTDLHEPGLLARRPADIGPPGVEHLPDWEQTRPRIPPYLIRPGRGRSEGDRR